MSLFLIPAYGFFCSLKSLRTLKTLWSLSILIFFTVVPPGIEHCKAIIVPLRLRPPVCIPAGTKKRPEWISFLMWCHQESNRGHKDFQSFALPTELWHLAVSREKRVQKYCFFLIYANIFAFFCEKGLFFLFFSLILTTFAPEKSLNDHFYATTTSYCPCP